MPLLLIVRALRLMSIHRRRLAGEICRDLTWRIGRFGRVRTGRGAEPAGQCAPLIGAVEEAGLLVGVGHQVEVLDRELSGFFATIACGGSFVRGDDAGFRGCWG